MSFRLSVSVGAVALTASLVPSSAHADAVSASNPSTVSAPTPSPSPAPAALTGSIGDASGVVRWHPSDSATILAGSGCTKNVDAFAFANGNDVAIVFTALGINLPAHSTRQLADRKSCAVRIPVDVPANRFVDSLEHEFSFGVYKSEGAAVAVSARASLLGFSATAATYSFPRGVATDDWYYSYGHTDAFDASSPWQRGFCSSSRGESGFYALNLAVSGTRDDASEDLVAFVDGFDLRYDLHAHLRGC